MDGVAVAATAKTAVDMADKAMRWYAEAKKAAATKEALDAAALAYFGAVLASTVAKLDAEFRTLAMKIDRLETSWSNRRRAALADEVHALAESEALIHKLDAATDFLRKRTHEPGWRERILTVGRGDNELDDALRELLQVGDEALRCVGAREKAPTPLGIEDVERKIRSAKGEAEVDATKRWAQDVLAALDRMTVRSAHRAFGGFASVLSKKHGLPAPDWTTAL
jgi:hypothetical protein